MTCRWQTSTRKDHTGHVSLGRRVTKQDPPPRTPMRTAMVQTLAPPRAGGDAGQKDAHPSLVKTPTVAPSEDTVAVSHRTRHPLTTRSSDPAPWHLPKEPKTSLHEGLSVATYSSFIDNHQTWKHRDVLREVTEKPRPTQTRERRFQCQRETSHRTTERKRDGVLPSDRNQSKEATYRVTPTT